MTYLPPAPRPGRSFRPTGDARRLRGAALSALLAALIAGAASPAHAGVLDRLFGDAAAPDAAAPAAPGQRVWVIHEFTKIERVPSEGGATPNQQPVQIPIETLRQQLTQIETAGSGGRVPLFSSDEIAELITPLAQALAIAGSGDDLLLLSSARREGGILGSPKAVTARVFVQDGSLQMIFHDARQDFYDLYRGTYVKPTFVYGSRSTPSAVAVQSAGATNRRPDWLVIPLAGGASAGAPAPAQPMQMAPAPGAAVAPRAAPAAAPVAPAARKPLDAGAAEDIERRLETLKRLHDKNLITDEEFRQKRQEILQSL